MKCITHVIKLYSNCEISFLDADCSRVSCTRDCPIEVFKQFHREFRMTAHPTHLEAALHDDSRAELYQNVQSNDDLAFCCSTKCFCYTSDGKIISNGAEWLDLDDPCTNHVCNNGVVSNHSAVCAGLPCSPEHRIYAHGECCPVCSVNWATFCVEDSDCDIACQFGFVEDRQRGCDLCKCAKRKIAQTTTSPTTVITHEATSNNDATPRSVHFYFYIDPTDGATKTLFIGTVIALCGTFVACLAAVGWYFHRRIYKKVPLLSLAHSSAWDFRGLYCRDVAQRNWLIV